MDFSSKLGEQLNSLDIDIAMAKSYLDKIFILYNLNSRQNAHNDNYIDCFLSKCSDIEKKDYSRNNLQAIKFNNINLECTIDDIIQDQNKKREKIFNIFKVERKSTFENNLILNRNRLLNSNPTHRLSRSKKIVTKDLPMSDHSKTNFKTSSNNINDSNIPLNPSKITDNIEEANNEFLKKNDRNSRLRLKKNTDNSLVDFTGLDQVEIKTSISY